MRWLSIWGMLILLPVVIGCGDGLGRIWVSGEVTYDGQPIQDGMIWFRPQRGTDTPIVIEPIKGGSYATSTTGGIPPGKYQVEIRAYNPNDPIPKGPGDPMRRQLLPSKYNTKSTLELVVETGQKKLVHDFTLVK